MTLRPEAMGGIVHRALTAGNGFDYIDFDVHPSLLGNTELLDMVFEANAAQNEVNDAGGGTYLLSQVRAVSMQHTLKKRDNKGLSLHQ